VERPFRGIERGHLLPVAEDRGVSGRRLLLTVFVNAQPVVLDRVVAYRRLLARRQDYQFVLLESFPGESEEDEDRADVHDVPAVAALVAADEPDECSEHVGAGGPAPDVRPAPELLHDGAHHERAERETDPRDPHTEPERDEEPHGDDARRDRPEELFLQVADRRLAPCEERSDAGQ
jgi:hypothetical protein